MWNVRGVGIQEERGINRVKGVKERKKRKGDDWSGGRGTIDKEVKGREAGKREKGMEMCVVEEGEGKKGRWKVRR